MGVVVQGGAEYMKFYIVTPTYNALEWLRRCIRSVADQVSAGVEVHHHVQDGGSADGTKEWLEHWRAEHEEVPGYTFSYESGKDAGMYDALNRALEKLPETAEVTAHLNSDEQYLPGALAGVVRAYEEEPSSDMVLGSFIIQNADGSYHCHRRPVRPHAWSSETSCEIITCSCFHKVSTFRKHGVRFDASYKSIGDLVFFSNIMKTNPRVCVRPGLWTSAYAMTGSNLAWTDVTAGESKRYFATLSWFSVGTRGLKRRFVNFIRRMKDSFYSPPRELSVYLRDDDRRTVQAIERPTTIWKIPQ